VRDARGIAREEKGEEEPKLILFKSNRVQKKEETVEGNAILLNNKKKGKENIIETVVQTAFTYQTPRRGGVTGVFALGVTLLGVLPLRKGEKNR